MSYLHFIETVDAVLTLDLQFCFPCGLICLLWVSSLVTFIAWMVPDLLMFLAQTPRIDVHVVGLNCHNKGMDVVVVVWSLA